MTIKHLFLIKNNDKKMVVTVDKNKNCKCLLGNDSFPVNENKSDIIKFLIDVRNKDVFNQECEYSEIFNKSFEELEYSDNCTLAGFESLGQISIDDNGIIDDCYKTDREKVEWKEWKNKHQNRYIYGMRYDDNRFFYDSPDGTSSNETIYSEYSNNKEYVKKYKKIVSSWEPITNETIEEYGLELLEIVQQNWKF